MAPTPPPCLHHSSPISLHWIISYLKTSKLQKKVFSLSIKIQESLVACSQHRLLPSRAVLITSENSLYHTATSSPTCPPPHSYFQPPIPGLSYFSLFSEPLIPLSLSLSPSISPLPIIPHLFFLIQTTIQSHTSPTFLTPLLLLQSLISTCLFSTSVMFAGTFRSYCTSAILGGSICKDWT